MTTIKNRRLLRMVEQRNGGFFDLDDAFEFVCNLKDALADNNVRWSLLFGTLLGAVRDGDIIPYDHDIDTGAVKADLQKEDSIIHSLKMRQFKPYICVTPPERTDCRYIQMNRKKVFGHMTWLLRYWDMPRYWASIMDYKPKTAKIRGVKFPIPDHVNEYLILLYGDWKTPRKPSDPLSQISAWEPRLRKRVHA